MDQGGEGLGVKQSQDSREKGGVILYQASRINNQGGRETFIVKMRGRGGVYVGEWVARGVSVSDIRCREPQYSSLRRMEVWELSALLPRYTLALYTTLSTTLSELKPLPYVNHMALRLPFSSLSALKSTYQSFHCDKCNTVFTRSRFCRTSGSDCKYYCKKFTTRFSASNMKIVAVDLPFVTRSIHLITAILAVDFFGWYICRSSIAIDFFTHDADSTSDFFGWATYSSLTIGIAAQADSFKTSMLLLNPEGRTSKKPHLFLLARLLTGKASTLLARDSSVRQPITVRTITYDESVLEDAACRRVFSGCSPFPRPAIPAPPYHRVSFHVKSGDDGGLSGSSTARSLETVQVTQGRWIAGWIVKESAMTFVRYPPQCSPGAISGKQRKRKSRWPGPPECESSELPMRHVARVRHVYQVGRIRLKDILPSCVALAARVRMSSCSSAGRYVRSLDALADATTCQMFDFIRNSGRSHFPLTKANRIRFPSGSLSDFPMWRWPTGFLGDLQFPATSQTDAAPYPPSSALPQYLVFDAREFRCGTIMNCSIVYLGFVYPESGKTARRSPDDQPEQLILHEIPAGLLRSFAGGQPARITMLVYKSSATQNTIRSRVNFPQEGSTLNIRIFANQCNQRLSYLKDIHRVAGRAPECQVWQMESGRNCGSHRIPPVILADVQGARGETVYLMKSDIAVGAGKLLRKWIGIAVATPRPSPTHSLARRFIPFLFPGELFPPRNSIDVILMETKRSGDVSKSPRSTFAEKYVKKTVVLLLFSSHSVSDSLELILVTSQQSAGRQEISSAYFDQRASL
ncbi:hypothetical protein PR048_004394 [Dryococelus australis]|uniref:Uncharacterized protein n=1 Tax=Dryococelus australis TaxID=614101 RepID=A0ABQ9I5B9_9NEOP|nr:hypothetical protein PR048_004394 [Dryococelus australis]